MIVSRETVWRVVLRIYMTGGTLRAAIDGAAAELCLPVEAVRDAMTRAEGEAS